MDDSDLCGFDGGWLKGEIAELGGGDQRGRVSGAEVAWISAQAVKDAGHLPSHSSIQDPAKVLDFSLSRSARDKKVQRQMYHKNRSSYPRRKRRQPDPRGGGAERR